MWVTRITASTSTRSEARSFYGERRTVVWDTLLRPHDMQPFVPMIGGRGFPTLSGIPTRQRIRLEMTPRDTAGKSEPQSELENWLTWAADLAEH